MTTLDQRVSAARADDGGARRDVLPGPEPHPPGRLPAEGALGRLGGARLARLAASASSAATCWCRPPASTASRPAGCSPTSTARRSQVRKFEGNPEHPGLARRNCAKGPATLNQITDPDRILHPLKRAGARGEGKWERCQLGRGAGRHRGAHPHGASSRGGPTRSCTTSAVPARTATPSACSPPGASTATTRTPTSARRAARAGYQYWMGHRPAEPRPRQREGHPAHQRAPRVGPLLQPARAADHGGQAERREADRLRHAPVEHRHARRPLAVARIRAREAAILLAIANHLIQRPAATTASSCGGGGTGRSTWRRSTREPSPTFENFEAVLARALRRVHLRVRRRASRASTRRRIARDRAGRGHGRHPALHAQLAQRGGRQPRRLAGRAHALPAQRAAGRGGHRGRHVSRTPGTSSCRGRSTLPPHPDGVERADLARRVPAGDERDVVPAAALPARSGRGKLDVYFTRVYNPVWTNPDGFSWIEALTDEDKVGLHVALTPTWSETAYFADYVLPWGIGRSATTSTRTRRTTRSGSASASRCCGPRASGWASRSTDTRAGQPGRGVGGERVLDRAVLAHRSRRRARHPQVLRVAGAARARSSPSTSTTAGSSSNSVPGLPERGRRGGPDAARVHAPLRRLRGRSARSGSVHERDGPGEPSWSTSPWSRSGASTRARRKPAAPNIVPHADARARRARAAGRWASRWTARCVRGFPTPERPAGVLLRARWPTGAGPNTRCRPTSRATSTPTQLDAGRDAAHLDVPAAGADPHPQRQRQVARRDRAHQPALDPSRATPRGSACAPATWCGWRPDRPLRRQGLGHRGHPAGRGRLQPPHGPLEARGERRASGRSMATVDLERDGRRAGASRRQRGVEPYASARPRHRRGSGGPTPACTRT